ncbi:hypothetical protein QUF80_16925 [Desulfococcaceae bacterium HSG8]|nr:hypothetical protein [Desulfococcaceae bacterium HSG8]
MTLGQYNSLSDKEKARLWDQWEDLTEVKEKEVSSETFVCTFVKETPKKV